MKLRYYLPRCLRRKPIATQILFLSFSKTLADMRDGLVSGEHLKQGLFYFQASRRGVMEVEVAAPTLKRVFRNGLSSGVDVYFLLCDELLVAENEGRVLWREGNEERSYRELNGFLVRHGYPSMPADVLELEIFTSLEVKRWAEKEKLPLAVFV